MARLDVISQIPADGTSRRPMKPTEFTKRPGLRRHRRFQLQPGRERRSRPRPAGDDTAAARRGARAPDALSRRPLPPDRRARQGRGAAAGGRAGATGLEEGGDEGNGSGGDEGNGFTTKARRRTETHEEQGAFPADCRPVASPAGTAGEWHRESGATQSTLGLLRCFELRRSPERHPRFARRARSFVRLRSSSFLRVEPVASVPSGTVNSHRRNCGTCQYVNPRQSHSIGP